MRTLLALHRAALAAIAVSCLLVLLTSLTESRADVPGDDDCFWYGLCYKFGLINCYYITGCPDIGFRCVVPGHECSYYPLWCPPCSQQ